MSRWCAPRPNASRTPLPAIRASARSLRSELGDLITNSIPACVGSVRTMIDGYDRYYGEGTGEAFFMGPYLDVLPGLVSKWTEGAAQ